MAYPAQLPTRKFTLRYRGIMDFEGLYNLIVDYYKSKKYWFQEDAYKHKVPSALGAEQEIEFSGTMNVTEYIKYSLKVAIHLWDMTEVEVERKGVKKKLISARMEIIFQGFVDVDWQKKFETSNLWVQIKDFYNKYIAKEEIESVYWDTLQYRTQAFMGTVKEYLDMESKGYEYSGYLGDNV